MRVGSRESKLAMRQTEIFIDRMSALFPDEAFDVVGMKALGDIDLKSRLDALPSTGAFVRELDDAILRGDIDCSVNSLKDIPIEMDPDLVIGAMLPRDDPRDVILPCPLDELPEGALVGTASVRRESILRDIRPDLRIEPLRGNIHTRLSRLDAGDFDAIILAKAGLDRMGIDRPMHVLDGPFIPAPAQGIVAVECRKDDSEMRRMLSKLDSRESRLEAGVERGIMKLMRAGCSSPVGINAKCTGDAIHVDAVSYSYTDEPRRVSADLPVDYVLDELLGIAEYLIGKRDVVI